MDNTSEIVVRSCAPLGQLSSLYVARSNWIQLTHYIGINENILEVKPGFDFLYLILWRQRRRLEPCLFLFCESEEERKEEGGEGEKEDQRKANEAAEENRKRKTNKGGLRSFLP